MVNSNKKKDSASYACEIDQNYQNKKYVVPQEKKNILLNSLAVQSLSGDFNSNVVETENNIIKIHDIDLKIEELLHRKKTKKNNSKKEKEEREKKEINDKELAYLYDSLPSLIAKNNYEKHDKKACLDNLHKYNDKNESNINTKINKDKINNKQLYNGPIIKYHFLHKILNSLTHKIDLVSHDFNKLVEIILNEKINKKDFITHGYEFIPENFLRKKNDKDLNAILSKKHVESENNLTYTKKRLKTGSNKILNIQKDITPKDLFNKTSSNLMFTSLEQNKKKN